LITRETTERSTPATVATSLRVGRPDGRDPATS
jgi:hypothetical protein